MLNEDCNDYEAKTPRKVKDVDSWNSYSLMTFLPCIRNTRSKDVCGRVLTCSNC